MRICFFAQAAPPQRSIAALSVDRLARALTRRGHAVTVVAPRPRWHLWPDDSRLPYSVERHWPFISHPKGIEWYWRVLGDAHQRSRFDVVHCHRLYPHSYLAGLFRLRFGVPVVAITHGDDFASHDDPALHHPGSARRLAWGVSQMLAFTAGNAAVAARAQAAFPDGPAVRVLPMGVSMASFSRLGDRPRELAGLPLPGGRFLAYCGRLRQRDGADVLLDAYSRLPTRVRPPLVLAGRGRDARKLLRRTNELGIDRDVQFVGPARTAVRRYLFQNALAAVLPSRGGASAGLIALEAAASGCAVVASRVAGLADAVLDGRTGWLAPAGQPEALAAVLHALCGNPSLAVDRGRRAFKWARQHDWDLAAGRMEELYASVGAGATRRRAPLRRSA